MENEHEEGQDKTIRLQRRGAGQEHRTEAERVGELYKCGQEFANLGGPEIAARLIATPGADVETFKQAMLDKQRSAVNPMATAEPYYGQGARVELPHGKLRCFVGTDGARKAHALGQFVRAQMPRHQDSARWCRENGMELRYLNGSSGPAGGYLVPDELSADMIKNMDTYGVCRQQMRVWPMGSDALTIPRRTGGITAAFLQNDTEATPSDPEFGTVNLAAKEVIGQTIFTQSLAEDSIIDLGDYVGMELGEAFALLEDQCGFIGTGTSAYGGMQGLLPKLKAATASCVTAAANHDTAPEIDTADLASLMAKLPQYADRGAKFYMSKPFYTKIILETMMEAGGNTFRTLEAGPSANPVFGGYEVVLSPVLPSDVTTDLTGEVMVVFGNLARSSAFGDRRKIGLLVDPYTYAGKSQIRVVGTERFQIVNHDVGDTSTTGPVVALIGA